MRLVKIRIRPSTVLLSGLSWAMLQRPPFAQLELSAKANARLGTTKKCRSYAAGGECAASNASTPTCSASGACVECEADALLNDAYDTLQIGELAGAGRDARRAIKEVSPAQNARAHAIVGQVFVLRGRSQEAEAEFEQSLRLDPSNNTAGEALRLQGRATTKRGMPER